MPNQLLYKYLNLCLVALILSSCVPKDSRSHYSSNDSYEPLSDQKEEKTESSLNFQEHNNIKNSKNMHKYTLRKYCVQDKCYTPSIISIGSSYRGIASWYGEKFHGKKTSNGETYDMYGISAAHKTFPMNTILRVKNISNGKVIILRVNDRGPFVDDRIIDLSFGAARAIGSDKKGLTEVELEVLGFNGRLDSEFSSNNIPNTSTYKPQREFIQEKLGIQLASFSSKYNAKKLAEKYKNNFYDVKIYEWRNDNAQTLYRVRIIGFKSMEEIEDYKNKFNLVNTITVGVR